MCTEWRLRRGVTNATPTMVRGARDCMLGNENSARKLMRLFFRKHDRDPIFSGCDSFDNRAFTIQVFLKINKKTEIFIKNRISKTSKQMKSYCEEGIGLFQPFVKRRIFVLQWILNKQVLVLKKRENKNS